MIDYKCVGISSFWYFVFPLYEAGDLADFIIGLHEGTRRRMEEIEIRAFARQIASGLQYLHERPTPVIHRDLKPDNIMMSESSPSATLFICDFGLSRLESRSRPMSPGIGWKSYQAPEVRNNVTNYTTKGVWCVPFNPLFRLFATSNY